MKVREYVLDCPGVTPEMLFSLHLDPAVLVKLSPPGKHVRVIAKTDPMRAGGSVSLEVRAFGIPMKWISRIDVWEPPFRFVDTQVKGPFAHWRHEHRFEPGRMTDHIEYEVPLARCGGRLVDLLFIRADLDRMFAYRHQVTKELLASSTS